MAKFRKRPVVIEARRYLPFHQVPLAREGRGDSAWPEGVRTRLADEFGPNKLEHACGEVMRRHGVIDTLEGAHLVCPGDWVITGIKGERYPCKPDIFEATYEAVVP